jgi:6-phosphofructokinase 1
MTWDSVGGILQKGGTIIGTARSEDFRTRDGRRQAARNLLEHEIDSLVVIGGDGSLTGANTFRQEWPELLAELAQTGQVSQELVARRPHLTIAGLVGSIDNDMYGTDMTIGTDTALHRVIEAIDAISSTAASHQRTFVVKVMGRNCGYLALMGALSTGADWLLIPENPPAPGWEQHMVEDLKAGRKAGRRDSIVVLAEGARDRQGNIIGSTYVSEVLEKGLGEEVRVTVLGHVQRGGSPSAFDRNLGTLMGYAAVEAVLKAKPDDDPQLIGMRGNRIVYTPLMQCVQQTQSVAKLLDAQEYDKAMEMRGGSFREAFRTFQIMIRSEPTPRPAGQKPLRLAILNAGAPAPGMNSAVRAAVRIGLDRGHTMLGVKHGFEGLIKNDIAEMRWMSVNGWAGLGGSELGTNRKVPDGKELYAIARNMEEQAINGLLVIGGWTGYQAAHKLYEARRMFPAFNIPIICMPASINNNLPGSELSIGADTALNNIIQAVDKIKQTAVALRRCYVVEVMGRQCGYLAMMSGLASGAERVYLNEEGVKLRDLLNDLEQLIEGFKHGKRLGLLIRNEEANPIYTTGFMCSLFEEEGGNLFDVRQTILGHVQQGGDPSPFDRAHATRLGGRCVEYLIAESGNEEPGGAFIGLEAGKIQFHPLEDLLRMMDEAHGRPKKQWWMDLRPIAKVLAQPMPSSQTAKP